MWVMEKSNPHRDSTSVRFFSITKSAPLRRNTGCSCERNEKNTKMAKKRQARSNAHQQKRSHDDTKTWSEHASPAKNKTKRKKQHEKNKQSETHTSAKNDKNMKINVNTNNEKKSQTKASDERHARASIPENFVLTVGVNNTGRVTHFHKQGGARSRRIVDSTTREGLSH